MAADRLLPACGEPAGQSNRAPRRLLRTTGMVKTPTIDIVLGLHATAHGIRQKEFWAAIAATHRQRASPLVELGEVAVWPATGPPQ